MPVFFYECPQAVVAPSATALVRYSSHLARSRASNCKFFSLASGR